MAMLFHFAAADTVIHLFPRDAHVVGCCALFSESSLLARKNVEIVFASEVSHLSDIRQKQHTLRLIKIFSVF